MHIAAADTTSRHLHHHFIRPGNGPGQIDNIQLAVLGKKQRFHNQPTPRIPLYNFPQTLRCVGVRRKCLPISSSIGKLILVPELPDITAYIIAIEARILGQRNFGRKATH
jgi:hypothetical protein